GVLAYAPLTYGHLVGAGNKEYSAASLPDCA
ncbi:MAG: hypothetical protein QOF53_1985, partial [Nocardioidaceae bacterium]|nr:hypothetical protein [Nocardioidaceae bacterium]